MSVKCINNLFSNLPKSVQADLRPGQICQPEKYITTGKEYVVYGVSVIKKYQHLLVCEDHR